MIQNGRVVHQEVKCGNIEPGKDEEAWEIAEIGLLANCYATLFADSNQWPPSTENRWT